MGTDLIGIQVLSFVVITGTMAFAAWVYFFPFQRLGNLKVPRRVEILGRDAIMNANSKGLDLEQLLDKISTVYPEPKKKGC